jgi:PBP1b-binding outer membrane lipoprotein LpoB
MRRAIFLISALLLAACTAEEEPVANRFDRTNAELENKARELENEVDAEVSAVESQMQNEIDAFANATANAAIEINQTNTTR